MKNSWSQPWRKWSCLPSFICCCCFSSVSPAPSCEYRKKVSAEPQLCFSETQFNLVVVVVVFFLLPSLNKRLELLSLGNGEPRKTRRRSFIQSVPLPENQTQTHRVPTYKTKSWLLSLTPHPPTHTPSAPALSLTQEWLGCWELTNNHCLFHPISTTNWTVLLLFTHFHFVLKTSTWWQSGEDLIFVHAENRHTHCPHRPCWWVSLPSEATFPSSDLSAKQNPLPRPWSQWVKACQFKTMWLWRECLTEPQGLKGFVCVCVHVHRVCVWQEFQAHVGCI